MQDYHYEETSLQIEWLTCGIIFPTTSYAQQI